jgi:hypothetical protein
MRQFLKMKQSQLTIQIQQILTQITILQTIRIIITKQYLKIMKIITETKQYLQMMEIIITMMRRKSLIIQFT